MEPLYLMSKAGDKFYAGEYVQIDHSTIGVITGFIVGVNNDVVHFRPDYNPNVTLHLMASLISDVKPAATEGVSTSDINMVDHPPHYKSETGLETIDVIEAFTSDLKGIEATDTGNIIKYICRWKHKNGLQDLEKARWYLNHLIAHIEKLEKENEPTCVV